MENKIERFIEPKDRLVQQIVGILFIIPGALIFIYVLIISGLSDYHKGDMGQVISAIVLCVSAIIAEYYGIILLLDLWKNSSIVELHDDFIKGYPRIGKKEFIMQYQDIVSIGPFIGSGWAIQLKDKNNNRFFISQHVEHLATCMNIIREKAVNAKKIDIKRWERNKKLWEE